MALPGNAFLALWHDIVPVSRTEYMEWHTREHMPERLSIPGFTVGKRLINDGLEKYQYGTIYAGQDLEVFRSEAYLDRLNHPTDWSHQIQPAFRNFLRIACERLYSAGVGDGGGLATVRLNFVDPSGEKKLRAGAKSLANSIYELTGVCGVHVGRARPEISGQQTRETQMRPAMNEPEFDAVVLVEGSGRPVLEAIAQQVETLIANSGCGIGHPQTSVYDLAYQLGTDEMHSPGRT
jgi:hypothetical protein